ncbi:tetratricopeptide repeat protein [Thalassobaculum salexigens]|uniref:tetratricopeptide repeat protein n=1 Tax=Thalassobaculum salexigens TaxID=455360 RepID=UPI0003FA4296|nr:tetratricopeptide repeat protein [Thalassobaculum salexigens]
METPQQILERATALHLAGHLEQAIVLYAHLLKSNPKHPDLLYRLGMALHQSGRAEAAAQMITGAAEARPQEASYRHALGVVLHGLGRHDEAVLAYEAALARDPLLSDTLASLGGILATGERRAEGVAMLRRAAVLAPASDEAWTRLGNHLQAVSDLKACESARHRALIAAPAKADRWVSHALGLMEIEQGDAAMRAFRAAAVILPGHHDAYNHLAWLQVGRLKIAEARTGFRRARTLQPDLASAYAGLSEAAFAAGAPDEAVRWMREALTVSPGQPHYRFRLGIQLLAVGEMAAGWDGYSQLRQKPSAVRRDPSIRLWNGVPSKDTTLLIAADQGVGDELLHACCIDDAARDVGRVVIECDQRIQELMRRSFPDAYVHAYHRVGDRNAPEHLYDWVPPDYRPDAYADGALLLSRYRGTVAQADAAARPWLKADPDRVAEMRERLAALGDGPKIGVAWRSRRLTTFRLPHYPGLGPFEEVLKVGGARFVSLQYGIGWREELTASGANVSLIDGLDTTNDIDGVFALVEALDLVICPSSTVGWIAAALGKPVWLLYNTPVFLEYGTDRFPGFPTVRSFRKTQVEPWRPLMAQVGQALADSLDQA